MADPAKFTPICGSDTAKFLLWCTGTGFEIDAQIDNAELLEAFRGFSVLDLKWLCQAIKQAGNIPDLATMRKATLARDVSVLRDRDPQGLDLGD